MCKPVLEHFLRRRNARHFLVADEFLLRERDRGGRGQRGKERVGEAEDARKRKREMGKSGTGKRARIVFCFVRRVGGHHDDRIEHKRGAPEGVTGHKIPRLPSDAGVEMSGLPAFPYKTHHPPLSLLSWRRARSLGPSKPSLINGDS